MKGPVTKFGNCFILRHHQIVRDDLYVCQGRIVDPEKLFYEDKRLPDVSVDCDGLLLAPGLIDLQLNGGFGVDFSADIVDQQSAHHSIGKVAKGILAYGITSFLPTLVTSPSHVYHNILPHIRPTAGGPEGASVLGLHLEGPFISEEKRGAHPPEYLRPVNNGFDDLIAMYGDMSHVKLITLAPELDSSGSVVKECVHRGISVSLGHTMATLSTAEDAFKQGAVLITHLFNAMATFHHRDPGLTGLLSSNRVGKQVFFGIIVDGVHTHPSAVRIAYQTNYPGMVLVSDAITAMGLSDGHYILGQNHIQVKGMQAVVAGTNTLCGAMADLFTGVRNLLQFTNCSLAQALEAASLHPAQALGIHHTKGTLDYGADADFIMIDQSSVQIKSTWISGQCVYQREPGCLEPQL